MRILFCDSGFSHKEVDYMYQEEYEAAKATGFSVSLISFEALTTHSKSGMPLTKEFRLFIKNGEIIQTFKYWDEGDYQNVEPNIELFKSVIQNIKSNFFTMDIAKQKNGDWIIMELGDGQVSGLADNANRIDFYKNLK